MVKLKNITVNGTVEPADVPDSVNKTLNAGMNCLYNY